MAKPTIKNLNIETALEEIFGVSRLKSISFDTCIPAPIGCGGPAKEFTHEISRKEYSITGLCQKCQDDFFGPR